MNTASPDGRIIVSYIREGQDGHFLATGSAALPDIKIDYAGVSPEERAGTATRLLGAAALYCLASTLSTALTARGARVKGMTGQVEARKARDRFGRTKVDDLLVNIEVDVDDVDLPMLEKCQKIMEHGCLVSYSLGQGVEVEHKIRRCQAPAVVTGTPELAGYP